MHHPDSGSRSKLPPLNAMRAFEAAARHLSLTTAAEELSVTRAAVGQQVQLLEAVLGIQLFHRGPAGLSLTERGRNYYVSVSNAIGILVEATEAMRGEDAGQSLRIVAQPNFAMKWLVPRLPSFRARHPELSLAVSAGSVQFDFADQQADVAIVYGSEFPGVRAYRLFPTLTVALCNAELAATLERPDDLQPDMLLRSRYLPQEWPTWLETAGVPRLDWRSGPIFDSTLLAVEAARVGLGVALGQREFVERELARGELVMPFETRVGSDMAWHLIFPTAAQWIPKVLAFQQWILDEVKVR
ncbi:MAG: LysR substrate-binding domain-containing protein [Lautropia sp.]